MTNISQKLPSYFKYPISEFQGNPLIEAIRPLPLDDDEILNRLLKFPIYDEKELSLPATYRVTLPDRLNHFVFPMEQHLKIFKNIYSQILGGYRYRNPLSRDGQEFLHEPCSLSNGSILDRTSTISFLTGKSGVGKSTLINSILSSFGNSVIPHSNYNGTSFTDQQITFLKHNAPEKCGLKSICETFGQQIDSLLGTNESKKLFPDRGDQTKFVLSLRKMLASSHVGILIVDAFENISLARAGGKEELAAFFGNMRDGLGVPMLLIGTYKAEEMLNRNMSTARRLSEGGYFELENPSSPEDEGWAIFCELVWEYQWVKKPKPFSEDIQAILFDLSQGINGIMLTLFIKSQIEAINSGTEVVDEKMIKYVYRTQLRPVHDMINALRSKDKKALARYEDLYRTSMTALNSGQPSSRYEQMLDQTYNGQVANIPSDILKKTMLSKKLRTNKRSLTELKEMIHD